MILQEPTPPVVVRGVMAVLSLGRGLEGMFAFTPVSRTVPLIQGGSDESFCDGVVSIATQNPCMS